MKTKWFWIICVIIIILLGILMGIYVFKSDSQYIEDNNSINLISYSDNNIEIINTIEISNQDEKTTPNTLLIYKTYYTKCKHYVQEYKNIDASLVNFTEEEFKEKCKNWDIDKFSSEEVEMSKEEKSFCGQHYKLKLENNAIVIYSIDERGTENEYEQTGITAEYLTGEDILKLTTGIYVYGKENLTSTLEDYE